jgi:hypothetical protein
VLAQLLNAVFALALLGFMLAMAMNRRTGPARRTRELVDSLAPTTKAAQGGGCAEWLGCFGQRRRTERAWLGRPCRSRPPTLCQSPAAERTSTAEATAAAKLKTTATIRPMPPGTALE